MYTDRQLREVFHFCFLERLLKLTDPRLYALKGGVNLRFYFHSPRYSEDMDLDVFAGNVETLKKNGYKILADAGFQRSLRVYGIEALDINDPGKAKQTHTTQRFRLGLITEAGQRLPTKIEFSRRDHAEADLPVELIDPELARAYRKLSFRVQHYSGEYAALQKVKALYGRNVTQARDVFDLTVLHAGGYVDPERIRRSFTAQQRQQACECVMALSFADFSGQVLEYLPEEEQTRYNSPTTWEQRQDEIISLING